MPVFDSLAVINTEVGLTKLLLTESSNKNSSAFSRDYREGISEFTVREGGGMRGGARIVGIYKVCYAAKAPS